MICFSSSIWKLTELKRAISNSQQSVKTNGWYPIFFENHDRPRSVNYYFPQVADKKSAAKALATILLTLRGTPFIYEGQELGCTNVAWNSIDTYDDIASHSQYNFALNEGFTPNQALEFVHRFSRDNSRTPMQWNKNKNAGFSDGKSWLPVNENYREINVEVEDADDDSVLNWYRKLAALRADNDVLTAGTYEEILTDSEKVFAFKRNLDNREIVTLVNFSTDTVNVPLNLRGKILIDSEKNPDVSKLMPLEARVLT